ncbi:hypothetical protein [Devosia sp.]|uniref:hypothetical protein n=1 Tax=Devosia sp. TaxID=1871048 RepID=UPI002F134520
MGQPVDREAEQAARRRRRSLVLALVLAAFVVIVYALTIAKMGPGVLQRPL